MSEEKVKYIVCGKCQDKGFIDTGNNDLPCGCEKGKKQLFNSAGHNRPITGEELSKELDVWQVERKRVKQGDFIKDYLEICRKHNFELCSDDNGLFVIEIIDPEFGPTAPDIIRDDP
jgi:hypothetical protein